jgi:hypothetical protein
MNLIDQAISAESMLKFSNAENTFHPFGYNTDTASGSISYKLRGQSGNQLFPLLLSSYLAFKNNLKINYQKNRLLDLKIPSLDVDPSVTRQPVHHINDDYTNRDIILPTAYYQNSRIFNSIKDDLVNHIIDIPNMTLNTEDVAMHVRLDGFQHSGKESSNIIHPSWYINILNNLKFNRLYIVLDTFSGKVWKQDKNSYLSFFSDFNPIIVSSSEKDDFNFLRSFNTFISSNSTFSWWCAFLSYGSNKFMPPYFEGAHSRLSDIDKSTVVDSNYNFIDLNDLTLYKKSEKYIQDRLAYIPDSSKQLPIYL